MPLIDHVNWDRLDSKVIREQRNRSAHSPVISLYRWWARRPHSFAGAVLDAAEKEFRRKEFLVADPFSGGGTVAFEAAGRGLPLYAQDLYPWPSQSLATALTPAAPDEFKTAAAAVLEALSQHRESYASSGPDRWETTHVIRVRSVSCPKCSKRIFLFRDPFISVASRKADESHAFFGCSACGGVTRRPKEIRSFTCDHCRHREVMTVKTANSRTTELDCPRCLEPLLLSDLLLQPLEWHPVLLRERRVSKIEPLARLRPSQKDDPTDDVRGSEFHALHIKIPDGIETAALRRYGFSFWDELYTRRQLDAITDALAIVPTLRIGEAIKQHLRLAILGTTEMAGYVCRWERYHPKALEAIANHRFSRSTITVETNLLSTSGRGTLPQRFKAAEKALRWMCTKSYAGGTKHAHSSGARRTVRGALVVTGSSERQLLRDGAAHLVFTDPPYHDDVQYGELSRLFHAWMAFAGQCEKAPDESAEAAPNALRGITTKHYEQKVAACLLESRRALASSGRLVLTFHNKNLDAWDALAGALLHAKFDIVALATVAAENSADHSKRGKQSFLSDLVIECCPRSNKQRPWQLKVSGRGRGVERKNLKAIGLALAERINSAEGDLETLFKRHLTHLKVRRALISRGGK
jgi:putative DNA methylase